MRRWNALPLVALLALGSATACEKQSPYVTVTAGGTVVKARAQKYCRGDKCSQTTEKPAIPIGSGDTLGIDVPRSLANDGWTVPEIFGSEVFHDHYRALSIPRLTDREEIEITVQRDPSHGEGVWKFVLRPTP